MESTTGLSVSDRATYQPDFEVVLERLRGAVTRMRSLDPLTTELMRLRGAAAHNCRKCKSLRNTAALQAGGSEDLYGSIEDFENADLPERHRVALRLTDAIVTRPNDLDAALVADVRRLFSPRQALEMVLDVVCNSSQKIPVTFGFDEARVTEGYELYETAPDGTRSFPQRTED